MTGTLPTSSQERIVALDALRGLALLGILLANLYSFMGYNTYSPAQIIALPAEERTVLFMIDWIIEGKFYGIFSMLFGLGFALQQERFAHRGDAERFRRYWTRRMTVLLCIGLLHMSLVWNGDILTLYAILGFFLPWVSKRSHKSLIIWIGALLSIPLVIHAVLYWAPEASFWSAGTRASNHLKQLLGYADLSLLQMRTSDNAAQVFWINLLKAIPRPLSYLMTGRYFQVLGMFLIGVVIARRWLSGISDRSWRVPRAVYWVGGLGLCASFGYAWVKRAIGSPFAMDEVGLIQALVYHVGAVCLAIGISAVLLKFWSARPDHWSSRLFATPGRMALSNYLFQNVTAVFIFFGYGLGKMSAFSFVYLPLFALGIFATQVVLSRLWLGKFAQGPLELVWKRLSYG